MSPTITSTPLRGAAHARQPARRLGPVTLRITSVADVAGRRDRRAARSGTRARPDLPPSPRRALPRRPSDRNAGSARQVQRVRLFGEQLQRLAGVARQRGQRFLQAVGVPSRCCAAGRARAGSLNNSARSDMSIALRAPGASPGCGSAWNPSRMATNGRPGRRSAITVSPLFSVCTRAARAPGARVIAASVRGGAERGAVVGSSSGSASVCTPGTTAPRAPADRPLAAIGDEQHRTRHLTPEVARRERGHLFDGGLRQRLERLRDQGARARVHQLGPRQRSPAQALHRQRRFGSSPRCTASAYPHHSRPLLRTDAGSLSAASAAFVSSRMRVASADERSFSRQMSALDRLPGSAHVSTSSTSARIVTLDAAGQHLRSRCAPSRPASSRRFPGRAAAATPSTARDRRPAP